MRPDNDLYEQIFESIEEGVVVVNEAGIIEWANPGMTNMFGYDNHELLHQTLEVLVPKKSIKKHKSFRSAFLNNPRQRPMYDDKEFEAVKKDGSSLWVKIGLNFYKKKSKTFSIAIVSDKTEKRLVENRLAIHAERAQLFFDLSKALFVELDQHGNVLLINDAGCNILGYNQEEILGKNWFDTFINSIDRSGLQVVFDHLMNGDMDQSEFVNSYVITKSGDNRLMQWHNTLIRDVKGKPAGTLSSGIDITANEELKKAQTEAILVGTEKERKRVAVELHDGLVQTLSAISMHLKSFENDISSLSEDGQTAYSEALKLLVDCIADTRAISHDLMPTVILRDGLVKALDDLALRTTKYHGIKVRIDPDHVNDGLNEMQRLNIYRIVQELIQNTIKHAKANSVAVKIRKRKSKIFIEVKDDGNGFDGSLANMKSRGIGLQNVQIRVDALNGELAISSSSEKGTKVNISIPVSY